MSKRMLLLNQHLIKRQGLTQKEVESLEMLHSSRMDIEEAMKESKDPAELRALFADWTLCQFELQKGWKFPEDINFHQFWTVPQCQCPVMDNRDRYPTGPYIYNLNCPVHTSDRTMKEHIDAYEGFPGVKAEGSEVIMETPPIPPSAFKDYKFRRPTIWRNEIEAAVTVVILVLAAALLIRWYVS